MPRLWQEFRKQQNKHKLGNPLFAIWSWRESRSTQSTLDYYVRRNVGSWCVEILDCYCHIRTIVSCPTFPTTRCSSSSGSHVTNIVRQVIVIHPRLPPYSRQILVHPVMHVARAGHPFVPDHEKPDLTGILRGNPTPRLNREQLPNFCHPLFKCVRTSERFSVHNALPVRATTPVPTV